MGMLLCGPGVSRAGSIIGQAMARRIGGGYPDLRVGLPNFATGRRGPQSPAAERTTQRTAEKAAADARRALMRKGPHPSTDAAPSPVRMAGGFLSERHAHADAIHPTESIKIDAVRATDRARRIRRILVEQVGHVRPHVEVLEVEPLQVVRRIQ